MRMQLLFIIVLVFSSCASQIPVKGKQVLISDEMKLEVLGMNETLLIFPKTPDGERSLNLDDVSVTAVYHLLSRVKGKMRASTKMNITVPLIPEGDHFRGYITKNVNKYGLILDVEYRNKQSRYQLFIDSKVQEASEVSGTQSQYHQKQLSPQ